MPIINKGILNSKTAFLRQVGNDWPTAQVVVFTTAEVSEASSNLYFTNTRVVSALIPGTGISIEANGRISANVSAVQVATQVNNLDNLTTTNLAEGTNLYFTTARARSAYVAGQGIALSANGVISSKGDDTGLGAYNSGINLANALLVANTFANLVTFESGDGTNFIVYSLHLTNYSNQTAYVSGRYVFGSNIILFANLFEMPGSSFIEMQVKPQTFKIGDQIQLQSFSSPTQPANNLISALVSYQGSTDVNFDRAANILTDNNVANIFSSVNRTSIIESVRVVNPNPTDVPVSVWFADPSYNLFAYVAANVIVPSFSSIELCDYPKAVRDNFTLRAQKSGISTNPVSILISSKYSSQYDITPSTLVAAEGSTISFDISTLNVADGTTLYYTVTGNVTQADFVTSISGPVVIASSIGRVDLTLVGAPDVTDPADSFAVQLRKNSIAGTILATSATVNIIDNANALTTTIVESASAVVEGSNITFTVGTFGVSNRTVYYSANVPANPAFFTQGNTGSFALVNGTGSFTLTSNSSLVPFGTTRLFTINLRTDNASNGTIFATSNVIEIQDTAFFGAAASNVRMLIVAGGGGGGTPAPSAFDYGPGAGPTLSGFGGGGGAGGLIENWAVPVGANTYTITIGAGGTLDTRGTNTIVNYGNVGQQFIAVGGGLGQTANPAVVPAYSPSNSAIGSCDGGSGGGGGGGRAAAPDWQSNGGRGRPTQQGNPGGGGWYGAAPAYKGSGGGGGGAGAEGGRSWEGQAPTGHQGAGGSGGDGKISSLVGMANVYFAGGGGGGGWYADPNNSPSYKAGAPYGGLGGGGRGGHNPGGNYSPAFAGAINTGGGGGAGGGATAPQGSQPGGSGIVVFNYPNAFRLPTTTGNVRISTANSNIIVQFYESGTIRF
jgi:hypothetical protein